MCSYSAVRNWLIGLLILLANAMSSIIFAMSVMNIPIWGQIASSVSFGMAAIWFAAAVAAAVSAGNALDAFCACTANLPICASACKTLKTALGTIAFLATGLAIFGGLAAFLPPLGNWVLQVTLALAGISLALTFALAYSAQLEGCQNVPPPTPPPAPPVGTGTSGLTSSTPRNPR